MSRLARLAGNPWWPVFAWLGVIFWFSAQPDLPRASSNWLDFVAKKSAHGLVYAILAGLLWRAASRTWPSARDGRWLAPVVWLATLGYAVLDEAHQAFVPGRTARGQDVLIDALGAGLMLVWIARQMHRSRLETHLHPGKRRRSMNVKREDDIASGPQT